MVTGNKANRRTNNIKKIMQNINKGEDQPFSKRGGEGWDDGKRYIKIKTMTP